MEKKRILIVEDEFITAAALKMTLERLGFEVTGTVVSGELAILAAESLMPDLILMDINLKGKINGIQAAKIIQPAYNIPVIFLTGQSDEATINQALESVPFGYIVKPFQESNLKTSILMALYKHSLDLKLRESEERYRAIAERSEDGIFIIAQDGTVVYTNGSAARLLGKASSEITGQPLSSLFSEARTREIRDGIAEVRERRRSTKGIRECSINDRVFWLEVTLIPLVAEKDAVTQVMMIIHDITDRVLLEKKLKKEGIARLDKNMEQFQVLNDQIRNPLQVITGLTILDNGPNKDKILKQAAVIDNLVLQLDRGWVESEKVRTFLLRHYRHGGDIDSEK